MLDTPDTGDTASKQSKTINHLSLINISHSVFSIRMNAPYLLIPMRLVVLWKKGLLSVTGNVAMVKKDFFKFKIATFHISNVLNTA